MINVEEIKKSYSFIIEEEQDDVYFCDCGNVFKHTHKESISGIGSQSDEDDGLLQYLYPDADENKKMLNSSNDSLGYDEIYKSIKIGTSDDILCPKCNKNFNTLNNQKRLIPINKDFLSEFETREDDEILIIFYNKFKFQSIKRGDDYKLDFIKTEKYLRFEKNTKKIFFKNFEGDEQEFDLDKVVHFANLMFQSDIEIIYNIYDLQNYIGLLAKHVADVNNSNMISELLESAREMNNYAGLDEVRKIVSIFLGIIKFSNLSTIALTKGGSFLYDLMVECDIPDSKTMIESNATSPVKIFNFLIDNYIRKINEEVNEDNKEKHEFVFKSKTMIQSEEKYVEVKELDEEREMKINFNTNENYKRKVKDKNSGAGYEVININEDATASKYIYKKLQNFTDFKQILKYFKFYNQKEIITLLQKYDLELLSEIIEIIYFRDKAPMDELHRIITIIKDFIQERALKKNPAADIKTLKPNCKFVREFEFTYYDDCIMMMEVLEFDKNREFTKIKEYHKLVEYHNNLVKYFNVVSDENKSKAINFSESFSATTNVSRFSARFSISTLLLR